LKSLLLRGFWLYIPVAALVGIFMLWDTYVGASMPVSGQIKHWGGFAEYVMVRFKQ
jgi:hypothetical protein